MWTTFIANLYILALQNTYATMELWVGYKKNHNHVLRHFLYVLFEKSEKECRAILKNNESPLPDAIHSDKRACLKKYVHNTCTTTQWTFS